MVTFSQFAKYDQVISSRNFHFYDRAIEPCKYFFPLHSRFQTAIITCIPHALNGESMNKMPQCEQWYFITVTNWRQIKTKGRCYINFASLIGTLQLSPLTTALINIHYWHDEETSQMFGHQSPDF